MIYKEKTTAHISLQSVVFCNECKDMIAMEGIYFLVLTELVGIKIVYTPCFYLPGVQYSDLKQERNSRSNKGGFTVPASSFLKMLGFFLELQL